MLSAVYFTYASQINNVMSYDAVAFLNSSFAVLVGIGVGAVLFATFFPETPAHASRRFRRQILVHLSRLASARRPDVRSYERALCEQLWTMLAGLKDEPAAAHTCLARAVAGLSAGQAIGRLRTAIDAGTLAPGIATKGSICSTGCRGSFFIPRRRNSSKRRGRHMRFVAMHSPRRGSPTKQRRSRHWATCWSEVRCFVPIS